MVSTSTISRYGGLVVHADPLLLQDNMEKGCSFGASFFCGLPLLKHWNQTTSGFSGSGSGSGSGSVGVSEAGGVVGFDYSPGLGFVPAFTRESVSCN